MIQISTPVPGGLGVRSMAYISSCTKILTAGILSILDYTTMSILKSASPSALMSFVACVDQYNCYSTDFSTTDINVYSVGTDFITGTATSVPVLRTVTGHQISSLGAFTGAKIWIACSKYKCSFGSSLNPSTVFNDYVFSSDLQPTGFDHFSDAISNCAAFSGLTGMRVFKIANPATTDPMTLFSDVPLANSPSSIRFASAFDYSLHHTTHHYADNNIYVFLRAACNAACPTCLGTTTNDCTSCTTGKYLTIPTATKSSCGTCSRILSDLLRLHQQIAHHAQQEVMSSSIRLLSLEPVVPALQGGTSLLATTIACRVMLTASPVRLPQLVA
jgi:hypothetical protein